MYARPLPSRLGRWRTGDLYEAAVSAKAAKRPFGQLARFRADLIDAARLSSAPVAVTVPTARVLVQVSFQRAIGLRGRRDRPTTKIFICTLTQWVADIKGAGRMGRGFSRIRPICAD